MSRPKDQGTKLETALVTVAKAAGLVARRIAEGGNYDEGDVELYDRAGGRHVVECKARQSLSLHTAYVLAETKARNADPDVKTAVLWKRLVRQDGKARRVAAGPPLIAMPLHDYLDLLTRLEET